MNSTIKYQEKLNRTFDIARFFALISIISAHTNVESNNFTIIVKFFEYISPIGVVIYLVMSGYFFNPNKYNNILQFYKTKIGTIILPWFLFGFLAYIYNVIASGNVFSMLELAKWIFGNGTYLYFMTVLMLCYRIFFYSNKKGHFISIVLNVVSLWLTINGYLESVINSLHITNYLNIFNWIGYFSIGMILKDINKQNLYNFLNKSKIYVVCVFYIILIYLILSNSKIGYFKGLTPIYELIGMWMVLSISTSKFLEKRFILVISKYSYTIYLIHMIVIGLIDDFYKNYEFANLFSPLIVLIFSGVMIYLGQLVSCFLKLEDMFCLVTGIRKFRRKV